MKKTKRTSAFERDLKRVNNSLPPEQEPHVIRHIVKAVGTRIYKKTHLEKLETIRKLPEHLADQAYWLDQQVALSSADIKAMDLESVKVQSGASDGMDEGHLKAVSNMRLAKGLVMNVAPWAWQILDLVIIKQLSLNAAARHSGTHRGAIRQRFEDALAILGTQRALFHRSKTKKI